MEQALTIRPSTQADIAAIDALLARSYPRLLKRDYPPSVLVTALPLISRAQPGLITSGTYFVAEDQYDIVAAGGWTGNRNGSASIRHVVTDHRHLRRGYATRLFEHIFDTARAAGVTILDCMSTRTAEPFYRSVGFEMLGPIELELRPGITFPAIRMQLQL